MRKLLRNVSTSDGRLFLCIPFPEKENTNRNELHCQQHRINKKHCGQCARDNVDHKIAMQPRPTAKINAITGRKRIGSLAMMKFISAYGYS